MSTKQKGIAIYRQLDNAYDEIRFDNRENFFVSYAVRGPSYVNDYGGVQYDMPLKCPLKNGSTVVEPSPLNSENRNMCSGNPREAVM
jgi:hypothetical protein